MQKFAKILVMIVRLLALVSIVLGVLVWTGRGETLVAAHIGNGFLVTICLLVLAVMALLRRATVPGVLGVVFGVLLPYVGFRQFPLITDARIAAPQVIHFIVAIAALGVAEMANGAIQRSRSV